MHRRQAVRIFTSLALCPLCASTDLAQEVHHWSYGGTTGSEEEGQPVAADHSIDASRLLSAQRTCYHYEGSLTTPPCSETVDWLILAHPMEVAEADITFAKLYPMNAGPVRNRDRRFILSSSPTTSQMNSLLP